jgi:thioredoxin reductase (NADPH)
MTDGDMAMDEFARRILQSFDHLGLSRLTAADFRRFPDADGETNDNGASESAIHELVAAGALREIAGGYERTEFGRLEAANPLTLTLLGRQGCHLCHDVLVWLEPLVARLGVTLRKVDVDADRVLRERFGTEVPVLYLGPNELARNLIEPRFVEKSLRMVQRANPTQ